MGQVPGDVTIYLVAYVGGLEDIRSARYMKLGQKSFVGDREGPENMEDMEG